MLNLLYITWDVDPILLHFGDGGIRWYGLLWAIGLYLCYLVQVRLYKHEHCPEDWPDKIFLWMALGVIIGARIGHCWFYEWHDVTLPWMANYCRAMNISTEPIQLFAWTSKGRARFSGSRATSRFARWGTRKNGGESLNV